MTESMTGLDCALIALSYFRGRNRLVPRFRRAKKRSNRRQVESLRPEMVRECRRWIRYARAKGWRGSVRQAIAARPKSRGSGRSPSTTFYAEPGNPTVGGL